jgi:hypothetical protein
MSPPHLLVGQEAASSEWDRSRMGFDTEYLRIHIGCPHDSQLSIRRKQAMRPVFASNFDQLHQTS